MKQFLLPLCLCLSFGMAGTASAATIIDFESLAAFNLVVLGPTYEEDGFTITNLTSNNSDSFGSPGSVESNYAGSSALYNGFPNGITELTATDGSAFDLSEMKLSKLVDSDPDSTPVNFTGNLAGGGTVTQGIVLDGPFGFETLVFSGFTNLTSVTWLQERAFHQFDDIVVSTVSAVPIPAAAWCFGSGLLALVGLARRRGAA